MKHLNFLLLVMMLGLSSLIYAQGETCATAVAVTPGIHNADGPATGGGLQLICQGLPDPGSADWYTFTPTVDGMISITHATPSSSELYLLSGTCAALFCEVFAFQTPISNFAVTAGTQYFIQWGDFQSSAAFNWTFDFVPVNDSCSTSTNLVVEPSGTQTNFTSGSTAWANSSPLALVPSCVFDNNGTETVTDLFYSFTLPAGATDLDILLNMLSGSGNNVLQYAIWDACGGTEMFCNDFIAATGTTSVTGLTAGSSYILQVSSAETEVADFEIGLEANIPPCNAGDVSATLASTPITYCAGNTVNFETDGTEVLSAGQVYIWYLEDSGSGQLYGLVSNSGNNYSGDLEAVTDANSNPQQIVSLPPGTYDIFGAATDGTPTNSCLTSNIGTVTVLAPNDPLCAPTCQVGDIAPAIANTTVTICPDGVITLQTDGNEVIPAGEEYLWVFVNQNTSAQTAVAIGPSYTGAINIDLGVGNELPSGTYDVYGALSDSSQTVVCGGVVTSSSFTLVILPTSDATCNPISCDITNLAPGAQTPCVASSNTYTQQVVVTFSDAPSTGMLEVNGQTFPIATSPQTVTLTGLDSDGAAVNVTASFTDETTCILTQNNLFVAPAACGSVGIQDLDLNALQIYPNPSKGMFNVAFDLASSKDINIKVISILGKELYRFEANNINGQFNHLVDLQDAIAGVYFVVISEGNKQSAHKIVIKK